MNLSRSTANFKGSIPPLPELALWILSIAVCSYFTLLFLFSALANYWPGPFVDYWIDIPNIEKFFNGTLTVQDLISAHANVHRLLIPRLLFIADYRFFSGSNTLLIWVSLFCKIATLGLFNHIIKDQPVRIKLLLNILLFSAVFNAANISNVLHNSNMQWDLVSIFSCFAIYFYSQNLQPSRSIISPARARSTGFAVLFFICGFFSQAGALPVVIVFVFISILYKRWLESILSFLFMTLSFYLTFFILPINEPQNPTYESALVTFIVKIKYVAMYVFKMFSGSIYFIDNHYFIFSWIMLSLLVLSLAQAHKTKHIYNNVFLNIALFSFLMMVTIAAARVDFAPKTWPANRYQTNVLLFILSLSLHCYFSVSVWFGGKYKETLQKTIFIISLGSFFISQYFLNNYGAIFGNKVFNAQAYMLTHGINQYNGAELLPSIQTFDRIAAPDPFFRQHSFAWYDNKQAGNGAYREMKKNGESLLTELNKTDFVNTCPGNTQSIQYNQVEDGEGLQFSTALNTTHPSFISAIMPRNTYYVLDENGVVIGFSYIFIDPDHQYSKAEIQGYIDRPLAAYIAEISPIGQPVCLYSLNKK